MASKITRQTFLQFGVNVNAAADICEFGTPATGTPVYTNVIATLQALAAWTTGWAAETVANNRPFLEDMNAVCYVFSYMIAYILQMGVSEYDAGTVYFVNSILQYNGILYQCFNDNSGVGVSGQVPTNATYFLPLKVSAQLGAWTSKTIGTIYQAATDGYVICYGQVSTSNGGLNFFTDSSATPSTSRDAATTQVGSGAGGAVNVGGPVRKGDYYEVTSSGNISSTTMWFIPSGQ